MDDDDVKEAIRGRVYLPLQANHNFTLPCHSSQSAGHRQMEGPINPVEVWTPIPGFPPPVFLSC